MDSIQVLDDVLNKEGATDEEKGYAYAYVGLNIVGGAFAFRGAGRFTSRRFWWNPEAFQAIGFRQSIARVMRASQELFNKARNLPWWDQLKTVSFGLLRDKVTGAFRTIAMSNQRNGEIPEAYNPLVPKEWSVTIDDATLPPRQGSIHAENRINAWAEQNGYDVVGKSASKYICDPCAADMVANGEAFFSPPKSSTYKSVGLPSLYEMFGFKPYEPLNTAIGGAQGAGGNDDD